MDGSIIRIDPENLEREHICCAIGNDAENSARAGTKKRWMRDRFAEGLVFKRLDERGKVFIEYMPAETCWRPIVGEGYSVIHCLWVSGRFKGNGWARALLDECVADARASGRAGIAVVSSTKPKPFLTDKKFFIARGFRTVDSAPPFFELLALQLDQSAPAPRFSDAARRNSRPGESGVSFSYSAQCPFMEEYVGLLSRVASGKGIPSRIDRLESRADVLARGSPFGTLGIYRDGAFLAHELMTEAKFSALLSPQ